MPRKKFSVWIRQHWIGCVVIFLIGIAVTIGTSKIPFGFAAVILLLLAIYGS